MSEIGDRLSFFVYRFSFIEDCELSRGITISELSTEI
jgi:hypothetical protein